MKEYNYQEIQKITKVEIVFKDGFNILFEECIDEWSIENNLEKDKSHCVAKRDCLAFPPYFLFYSKERVKVFFEFKGLFKKSKNYSKFRELQIKLNNYGYITYDLS